MKAEYDFSKAQRGKFYSPEAEFKMPIYLDADVSDLMTRLAIESGTEVQVLVNEWLRANLRLVETVRSAG